MSVYESLCFLPFLVSGRHSDIQLSCIVYFTALQRSFYYKIQPHQFIEPYTLDTTNMALKQEAGNQIRIKQACCKCENIFNGTHP